jgi:hypothetical protein
MILIATYFGNAIVALGYSRAIGRRRAAQHRADKDRPLSEPPQGASFGRSPTWASSAEQSEGPPPYEPGWVAEQPLRPPQ